MTLFHGRSYLAIPGPSVMPDKVLNAMHQAAPNIYEGALVEMVAGMIPDLKAVARSTSHMAIYIANGHGAWEGAASNVLSRGDKVLVLATGRFGMGWADFVRRLGAEPVVVDFGLQSTIDLERAAEALKADPHHAYRAVVMTHVDTSSSVLNDVAGVRALLDDLGHPALLMVDCIASLACDRFEMDAWGVDVMVAASQKGLMTPPGLSFVFFSDKAAEAQTRADMVTPYWDWSERANPQFFYQNFGGTAPTHHLLGLRAALDLIAEEGGIETVWYRHEVLARCIWAAVERWGAGGPLRLNISDPALRSHAVTALYLGEKRGETLRRWTESHAGVTLGLAVGMSEPGDPTGSGYFRIGHMGHVNAHMVLGVLGVIEAGLKALDIPHGEGAVSAAAEVIAQA